MFIDRAKIRVQAGGGGHGCRSFFKDRSGRIIRSEGGDGGRGGNVVFRADAGLQTLKDFHYRRYFRAANGSHGSGNQKKGKNGTDLIIRVPPGTLVHDEATGCRLRDLTRPGEESIIARGGRGGRGNSRREEAEKGFPGEEKILLLELKLLADVGIIGCPNAGKSTLISRVSSARPKIADYPFTTTSPVLGAVRGNFSDFVIADIPGLIEGAHKGKGLGDQFLRHIERAILLIHLVNLAPSESRDPYDDYQSLNTNLRRYGKALIDKPQVIAANKIDVAEAETQLRKFRRKIKKKIFPVSALTGEGVNELMAAVEEKLNSLKRESREDRP